MKDLLSHLLAAVLFLALVPGAARAQSIFDPTRPDKVPDASPRLVPEVQAPPAPRAPVVPSVPNPADAAQAKHLPSHGPKPGAPLVVPPGAVVVAPGSVIIPPAATTQKPGPSDRLRAGIVERCNKDQLACTSRCNSRTYGQARNLCYNQCRGQFTKCTQQIEAKRR